MNDSQKKKVKNLRRNYSKGVYALQMEAALEEAQRVDSPKVAVIAQNFGVSRTSLDLRLKGQLAVNASPGKKPLLNEEEEERIVQFLLEMSAMGFGFSLVSVRKLISSILGKDTSSLTTGWVNHFFVKHPILTIRRTEAFDRLRVRAIDAEILSFYFMTLEMAFLKCKELSGGANLTAGRILAMDETGLQPCAANRYVIAQKGKKSVQALTSESRDHLTMVAYASAEGCSGNPFFILPKRIVNFLGSHFPGSKSAVSGSGYMNDTVFEEWCEFLVEDLRPRRQAPHLWCLLVLDSLHSHTLNPKALQILNSANILAVALPSHTSSFLQVHDISIFGPLKKYFRSSISNYAREKSIHIQLQNLPEILEEPWVLANNSLNVKKGFQKAGIWPLNTNWVQENFEAIAVFKRKDKEEQLKELNDDRLLKGELKSIFKSLEYLDLARKLPEPFSLPNVPLRLERALSSIVSQSKESLKESLLRKNAPRKKYYWRIL